MQKLYNIVKVMLIFALLITQNALQAQKCCVECQTDVKVISDKQVLLEKIDLKDGTLTTNINTNLYVSYRSGNSQKFWTNLVIATAGVAVSTQLNKATLAEGKSANGVSPLLPLGVSVATLPSIWKNRPRGIPQAGLWIQHRDTRGKLLETWEQPISNEAKNDAELLTVSINKPLSAGTLEVYLQNGSKNGVYYWGYKTTSKSAKPILQNPVVSSSMAGCPDGYLPNGNGMCCNPFTGDCVSEGGGQGGGATTANFKTEIRNTTTTTTTGGGGNGGGCPEGYLPNGNGMCCNPFTGDCVSENQTSNVVAIICVTTYRCVDTYRQNCIGGDCDEWILISTVCTVVSVSCNNNEDTGGGGGGGDCANGRDGAGNPCGTPICGSNGYNQFGIRCGRNCNETTGFDQFGDPCGPSICGVINPNFISSKQARVASFIDQYGNACANIEDSLTTNCFKNTLLGLKNNDMKGTISNIFQKYNKRQNYNFTIKEAALTGVYSQYNAFTENGVITLNTTLLKDASKELIALTILHEMLHVYIDKSELADHIITSTKYVDPMADYVSALFGIDKNIAKSLIWSGLQDTPAWGQRSEQEQYQSINNLRLHTNLNNFNNGQTGTHCN